MNRRDVLRLAGLTGTVAVAGCLGDDDDGQSQEPTATPTQPSDETTPADGGSGDSDGGESTDDESETPRQSGDYDTSTPTATVESFFQTWQDGNVDAANELIYDDGNVTPIEVDPEQLQRVAPEIETISVVQENNETAIVAAVLYTPARDETLTNQFELVAFDGEWQIGSIIDMESTEPSVSFGFERDGQRVEVVLEAGDAIRAETLTITGTGLQETGSWDELTDGVEPNDLVVAGDTTTVDVESEYTVQISWQTRDQSAILGVTSGDTTGNGDSG